MAVTVSDQILVGGPFASVDKKFGPYESIEEAKNILKYESFGVTVNHLVPGLRIGIINGDKIDIYTYEKNDDEESFTKILETPKEVIDYLSSESTDLTKVVNKISKDYYNKLLVINNPNPSFIIPELSDGSFIKLFPANNSAQDNIQTFSEMLINLSNGNLLDGDIIEINCYKIKKEVNKSNDSYSFKLKLDVNNTQSTYNNINVVKVNDYFGIELDLTIDENWIVTLNFKKNTTIDTPEITEYINDVETSGNITNLEKNSVYKFVLPLDSLTINNVEISSLESKIIFKSNSDEFNLELPNYIHWLNGKPNCSEGKEIMIAIANGFAASLETNDENENLPTIEEIPAPSTLSNNTTNPNDVPTINIPDEIYAVVGDTLLIFYRSILLAINPENYYIKINFSGGHQYKRHFEYTPTSPGNKTLTISVYNNLGIKLTEKSCLIRCVNSPYSPLSQINIACFGDSLSQEGVWIKEAARRLTGTGGTPSGNGISNINFIGPMGSDNVFYFGRTGWQWRNYVNGANTSSNAYAFHVSEQIQVDFGDTYQNNGKTFTIYENNSGNGIIIASGTGSPSSSGTLTKISGNGVSTISFSSVSSDSLNPIWDSDTNSISFTKYALLYGNGNLNVVVFFLGWNGLSSWQKDFTSFTNNIKTISNKLHSEFPEARMVLMGLQLPDLNGGGGYAYSPNDVRSDWYGMVNSVFNYNNALQELANTLSYVDFVNVSSLFDSEYLMPYTSVPVNTRSTVTIPRGSNGVHPSNNGYKAIGDIFYRYVVGKFCQTPTGETVQTPIILIDSNGLASISCATSGASIYYTVDNTNPTSSSNLYSTPIQLTDGLTIKAIGIKSDMANSQIATNTYNVISPDTPTELVNLYDFSAKTANNNIVNVSVHPTREYQSYTILCKFKSMMKSSTASNTNMAYVYQEYDDTNNKGFKIMYYYKLGFLVLIGSNSIDNRSTITDSNGAVRGAALIINSQQNIAKLFSLSGVELGTTNINSSDFITNVNGYISHNSNNGLESAGTATSLTNISIFKGIMTDEDIQNWNSTH